MPIVFIHATFVAKFALRFAISFGLFLTLIQATTCAAATFGDRPEVRLFVSEMASKHGFDAAWLQQLFDKVTPRPSVTQTMTGQVTKPPSWIRYRSNFVTSGRISGGVGFWRKNEIALSRARHTYGVPEEIIVAIIGVETRYGTYPLAYPVLDTLATLAFDYPRRAEFFRGELEQYLLLMREEGRDPFSIKGSFAGAMGIPQFMPSSYRQYGVDFDSDGLRDLWSNPVDAIGSVANYLKMYGWMEGQAVAVRAGLQADVAGDQMTGQLKPEHSIRELQGWGVRPAENLPTDVLAALHSVDVADGREYWLGLNNFYVITRYNRSLFYALAVFELSEAIRAARLGVAD